MENQEDHWDKIYESKTPTEVSWYEPLPEQSLSYIIECELQKDASIIDIGGGDSFLAEFLLAQNFKDVTVVDISQKAIDRAKLRLGERAEQVDWIKTNVLDFTPDRQYDVWHDRAAFHFLIEDKQVEKYVNLAYKAVKPGGFVVLGTFSESGPNTCSGLKVRQYSIKEMQQLFLDGFTPLNCKNFDHSTPSGDKQNFTFCSFRKD